MARLTKREMALVKSLLEQLWGGEWHPHSSLYAKGFKHTLISMAHHHEYIEIRDDGDKHEDWFRITDLGRAALKEA